MSKKKHLTKRQKMRKRRKRILITEVIVLLFLSLFLFAWLKLGLINFNKIGEIATNNLDAETEEMLKGYTTIALFGVDNRSNGNYDSGNSDSIMIAAINNDTKEVKIVSVYRDTALDVDGDKTIRKANYAYNHGGPEEAIAMLNRNLDLDIQDYVAVDFNALVEAVDAVGGVEITLTNEEIEIINEKGYMNEVASVTGHEDEVKTLKAGTQTVNGVVATAYCRIRYTSGGDFARAERQRTVVSQLIAKAQNASLTELNSLIDGVFPKISTSLSLNQLIGLAAGMKDYQLADSTGFPFALRTGTISSKTGSLDVPCTLESNVKSLYAYLYGEENYQPSAIVQDISSYIEKQSGYDENDATDYGYGTTQTSDGSESSK
ncbi:MAG: LCP family protein [Lachnospiraceae bacterium]|nr:LCP family protein [Lachnospiraceae bacterium]